MTPAWRAFLAHVVAFPVGVVTAWGVVTLLGGAIFGGGPATASAPAALVLVALGFAAGFAAWTFILGMMLGFTASSRWWMIGLAMVLGLLPVGIGLATMGWFTPNEALILVLFLLFALGGWAASKQVDG